MKSKYAYRSEWYEKIIRQPEEFSIPPFCIFGNLWFIGNKDAAVHLVDTGEGLMVFDTGYPHMQDELLHSIEKCGFHAGDIRMIFHTHGHFDHFGATARLMELSGAVTYMGARDADMINRNPELTLCSYFTERENPVAAPLFRPDVWLNDQDIITLGNTTVRVYETPGHSAGAVTYQFPVTDGKKIYTAVLTGGAGFNTLCRDFIEVHGNRDWREDFERSLSVWKIMKCDIYLGNHTGQSDVLEKRNRMVSGSGAAGNPFLDDGALRRYAEKVETEYRNMLMEEG